MEEGQKHIDDFFREELGNYTEMPPEKVWEDLSQRLDDARRPRFWGWWPWIVVLLLIGSVAGYMVLSKKHTSDKEGIATAVIDKGISVSSNGINEPDAESLRLKVNSDNTQVKPIDTTQRTHFEEKQLSAVPKAENKKPNVQNDVTHTSNGTAMSKKPGKKQKMPNTTAFDNVAASGPVAENGQTNGTTEPENKKQKSQNSVAQTASAVTATKTQSRKQKTQNNTTSNNIADNPKADNEKTNSAAKTQSAKPVQNNTAAQTAGGIAITKAQNKKQKTQSATTPNKIAANEQDSGSKETHNATAKKSAAKAQGKQPKAQSNSTPTPNVVAEKTPSSTTSNEVAINKPAENKKNNNTSQKKSSITPNANTSPYKPRATQSNPAKAVAVTAAPDNSKKQTTEKNTVTGKKTTTAQPAANNKTTKTPATANNTNKQTSVVPAADQDKKPLPQQKPDNAVAKTNTFQPTPNPPNNLLVKPAEEQKKGLDNEKDDEEDDKTPMTNDDDDDNDPKPQQPQPAAEHDPRAGIPVSGYIDKAVAPQPKPEYDEDDPADKKKIEIVNPAGGAGGDMSPSVRPDRKAPSMLEGGAKFGFEKGFSTTTANKWVATIYLQYNLTPKAAFLIQPSVKFAQMNQTINSSQSFYNVTGTTVSSTQRTDSISAPPFYDTVYNYYYKQTYDSMHVSHTSTKNYVEFEIPLIFKYAIAENLSLLAGVTMNFGNIPTVSSSTKTYTGLTLQDSVVNVHNNPNYPISVNDSFHHTAQPYSSYNPTADQNSTTNPLRFGYLLGMNYLLKDRVLFDLTIQQSFSKMTNVSNADIRSVLTQPYVRFSVGYKIFQSKKKTPQQ
ncbi:hypothetical protein [Taibaiella soli]|uniref:Outer membrane protein beta-barrel domain-containing protein n=1 Tax=Taibaiella soli TaxID=1649169 RepID=A0A2W2BDL3_9BACT|nr:hypothetical protein [Taibaiella soli]PZF71686.1 hypothetical protein DN068_16590 [Taibaiella soli]